MQWLWCLPAIAALFLVILLIGGVRLRPKKKAAHTPFRAQFDADGALDRFAKLIRLRTVWPREGEIDYTQFDAFLPTLRELFPRITDALEFHPVNTYGILLRWKGTDADAKPVVLMSHYDVVAADAEKWTRDPFGGEIADGEIWGRGTVDTKCILSALLEAGEALLAEGYAPRRDVWFSFTNNEETGGNTTPAIVEYLKEKGVEPWFVLDEGGAVVSSPALGVKNDFAMVGVSEKGVVDAVIRVSGVPGHSSTPKATDSPARLLECYKRIVEHPFRPQLADVTRETLCTIAAYSSFTFRMVFGSLWLFAPLVKKIMLSDPETAAMLRTTVALTRLKGSDAINIIPNVSEMGMSVRVAPWDDTQSVLRKLTDVAGENADVSYEYKFEPSPISPTDSDAFRLIADTVDDVYPGVPAVPYVMNGGTDSKHFTRICPYVYRFAGFRFTSEERGGMHGNDERLATQSYLDGVSFYTKLLQNLNEGES